MKKLTLAFAMCSLLVACSDNNEPGNNATENNTTTVDMAGGTDTDMTGGTDTDMTGGTDSDMTGGTDTDMTGGTDTDMGGTDTDMGGTETLAFCQEECTQDSDCEIVGSNLTFTCDTDTNRCVSEEPTTSSCTDNDACVAQVSGWTTECQTAEDCPGQTCIDHNNDGTGHCATEPSEFLTCEQISMEEIETKTIAGEDVVVCGNPRGRCDDSTGACILVCTEDAHCANDYRGNVCNTETGACQCNDDSNCTFDAAPACGSNNTCGCGTDDNCKDNPAGDVCTDGICTCSGDEACTNTSFSGTTPVCGN